MRTKYIFIERLNLMMFGLLVLSLLGCKKFVEIGAPATQLVTQSVFNNDATATAAQMTIYIQMANNSESWNISQGAGLLADELTSHSSQSAERELYTNNLLAVTDMGRWTTGYNYIYQANAIIAGLEGNKNLSPLIDQQLIGESKFLRAFWYFYLTNMYGDVPLVLTTDYNTNDRIVRTSQGDVYAQIIKDLGDAGQLLNSNYVDGTDTTVTTERVRPTKWAAAAMLARVYLYIGKFDSAEAEASIVLNNLNFQLCSNLSPLMGANSTFLKNSSEAIWQLSTPLPASFNTPDGQYFILKGAPSSFTTNSTTISPELQSAFEPGDLRRANWIGVYKTNTNPSVSYYYPFKYHVSGTSTISEYVMVLRLAEQYLIRAEARARQGETANSIADLNVIRSRAGLSGYAGPTDQASLVAAILHEKQVELFTEWGHRWFDLIRTNSIDSVMSGSSGVSQAKGSSWRSSDRLYPIPQNDINNDPNLSQNTGY